jgi:hypothetical protein
MKKVFVSFLFLLLCMASVRCSVTVKHFEDWVPLETRSDSVRIAASDTSMRNDSGSEMLQQHLRTVSARSSRSTAINVDNWPSKMDAHLLALHPTEEQYYVQFAIHVDGMTAAIFQSFTGQPLLSMVSDRAFVSVGSRSWAQKARAFPGVVFVASRSHASKVYICSPCFLYMHVSWLGNLRSGCS